MYKVQQHPGVAFHGPADVADQGQRAGAWSCAGGGPGRSSRRRGTGSGAYCGAGRFPTRHPRSTAGCAVVPDPTPVPPSANGRRPPSAGVYSAKSRCRNTSRALKERCRSTTGCRSPASSASSSCGGPSDVSSRWGHDPGRAVASLLAHGAQVAHTGSVGPAYARTPGTPHQTAPGRCAGAPATPAPTNGSRYGSRRWAQTRWLAPNPAYCRNQRPTPNRRKTSPNISKLGRMAPAPASAGAVCRLTLTPVVIQRAILRSGQSVG